MVTKKGISDSFKLIKKTIESLSDTIIPEAKILCEPQLSKRKLYPTLSKVSKFNENSRKIKNMLNFLQYSDKLNNIDQISKLIKLNKKNTFDVYNTLKKHKLLKN